MLLSLVHRTQPVSRSDKDRSPDNAERLRAKWVMFGLPAGQMALHSGYLIAQYVLCFLAQKLRCDIGLQYESGNATEILWTQIWPTRRCANFCIDSKPRMAAVFVPAISGQRGTYISKPLEIETIVCHD
jgi:hypothetical protein